MPSSPPGVSRRGDPRPVFRGRRARRRLDRQLAPLAIQSPQTTQRGGDGIADASTDRSTAAAEESVGPAAPSGRRRVPFDPLIAVCAAVLIAFPFAATVAASKQPIARSSVSAAPRPTTPTGPVLRDVPAFSPAGAAVAAAARGTVLADLGTMREALRGAMSELFDRRQRAELERLLTDRRASFALVEYPFRFRRLDAVLNAALPPTLDPRQTRAANDLGALLILAAARFGGGEGAVADRLPTAAALAFAILDRARTGRACLPQLNLAFLLSTHTDPLDEETAMESSAGPSAAVQKIPHRSGCLANSSRSASTSPGRGIRRRGGRPFRSSADYSPRSTGSRARLPTSSAGWSGRGRRRAAPGLPARRAPAVLLPARSRFRRALTLYRRARTLDRDPGLAAGEARALAGWGSTALRSAPNVTPCLAPPVPPRSGGPPRRIPRA